MLLKDEKIKKGDIIYYSDPLNDDFEKNKLERKDLPKNFKYIRKNIFFRLSSFLIYFLIAKPILGLICLCLGVKVKGRENLKKVHKQGAFLYMNHTSFLDVLTIQVMVVRFKRAKIIGYTDSLDLPFLLKWLTLLLGFIPLPSSIRDLRKFEEGLVQDVTKDKKDIIIFPEAHIWPYCTDIRPFVAGSFKYPAKLNAPAIPLVTCFRKSKLSSKPKATIYVLKPVYPKEALSVNENRDYLRDECFNQMKEAAKKYNSYEYVKYVYKEKEKKVDEE